MFEITALTTLSCLW